MKLESYVEGAWKKGSGVGRDFIDPCSGEVLGQVDATGIDPKAALAYARETGGPALQDLTFEQRGGLLRAIADCLAANREDYAAIARRNSGNTAVDAAIDIDGAIATLKVYARYAKGLGAARSVLEPGREQLAREEVFFAQHLWTTRPGVALHINAFNFPAWGLWEKAAVALLAGVPAVAKPASATAWLSHQMVRDVAGAGILPEGALSLVCGTGEELLDALRPFDHLAFTGSSDTAQSLRKHPRVMAAALRITIEADSVNATLLGPDAKPGDAIFELMVREVVKALTVKAGQLCTNIRRVLVAAETLPALQEAVAAKLAGVEVGDPANESVRMGPLINKRQQHAALSGLSQLSGETDVVCGGDLPEKLNGGDRDKGAFLAPTLLACPEPQSAKAVFETEVFGPAATLIPYRDEAEALDLVRRAGGSLVASLFTDDPEVARRTTLGLAPHHGRVLVVDATVGKNHTGHSIVMPQCVHGGPGRAGNGEELGGLRGLSFYMQRSAIQGSPALLDALASDFGLGLPLMEAEELPLPSAPHRPGSGSSPDRAPLERAKAETPERTDPDAWAANLPYRYGWRLYEAGFFWEAHEVWEAVWLACRLQSRERLLLQVLIQLANARLKRATGQERAVARLLQEIGRLRAEPGLQGPPVMAVSQTLLAQLVREINE